MKTIFTLLPVFLFFFFWTLSPQAQLVEDWTDPVALTDSMSNNSNPTVVINYGTQELFMFYEKGETLYKEIWWRKISEPMSEEQMFIGGWPEVDYRNPQILFDDFLIFECNIFENYDLFGVKFNENGLAGDIFQMTNTSQDENNLCCYSEYSYYGLCSWVSSGDTYVTEIEENQDTLNFTDIIVIDSGNCSFPVCTYNYVAWQKEVNDSSHIYYSIKTYPSYQWSDPESIINTGNNINLTISKTAENSYWDNDLCWQSEDMIYFSDLDGNNIYSPEIPGVETFYEPDAIGIIWYTDYYPDYFSFVGETDSVRNIYFMDLGSELISITNDAFINKNPGLHIGRNQINDYEVINIWQTEINGNNVLYSSIAWYTLIFGNVDENEILQLYLSPNPFTESLNIELKSDQSECILFEIFSISGQRLFNKEIQGQPNTQQSISLNPKSEGLNLTEGIYLVKLTQGKSSVVQKVVCSN